MTPTELEMARAVLGRWAAMSDHALNHKRGGQAIQTIALLLDEVERKQGEIDKLERRLWPEGNRP